MEPRLAARIAREFIDQFFSDVDTFRENFSTKFKEFNSTGKFCEILLSQFSTNPALLTSYLVLKKNKSSLMGVEFFEADINPYDDRRKERLIAARPLRFSRKKIKEDEGIIFSISQHCIQRIVERSECDDFQDHKTIYKHIYKQLECLPIYTAGLCMLMVLALTIKFNKNSLEPEFLDPEIVFNSFDILPVSIPTRDGILYGETHRGKIHIRTFLSDSEMKDDELEGKRRLVRLLNPLKDTYAIYNFQYSEYFNNVQRNSAELLLIIVALELMQEFDKGLDKRKIELAKKKRIKRFFQMIRAQNEFSGLEALKREILDPRKEDWKSDEFNLFIEKGVKKGLKNT